MDTLETERRIAQEIGRMDGLQDAYEILCKDYVRVGTLQKIVDEMDRSARNLKMLKAMREE